MKNLKKLLAVIVAVAMMATLMVPAFAADLSGDQKICKDLNMLKGGDDGFDSAYWAEETDRVTATLMYLRLIGEGDAADSFAGSDKNFADAEDHVWGGKVMAYVYANKDRLGIVGVGGDNFEPNAIMDSKSYYKIMLNALGFEQDVDYTWGEVLEFAGKQGLTKIAANDSISKDDIATATVEALKANVKGGEMTLIEKLVENGTVTKAAAIAAGLIEDALVAKANAIGAKKLEVSFNKAVDTAKAAFGIKKGTITINTSKVEWNEEKTVATITLVSAVTKGDYTITVSGLEFPEDKNVLTVTAENEKVTEVEITSDVAPLVQGTTNVQVNYVIKNQYGENITAAKTGEVRWTYAIGTADTDTSVGVKEITGTFAVNNTFTVTALHANTGTFATKVMKVGDFSRVAKIEALSLYNKDDKTLFTNSTYTDFYVKVEAFDQYDNKITNTNQLNNLAGLTNQTTVIISTPGILGTGTFATIPGTTDIGYQLAAPVTPTPGAAAIYFYSNITGHQSSFTVDVAKTASLDSLLLESPADIAVSGEKVVIPFAALDQNGVPLSETAIAALTIGASPADVNFTSTSGGKFAIDYDYETKKAVLTIDLGTGINPIIPKGNTIIMAVTRTGKVSQIAIDVKEAAKATAVVGTKDLTALMGIGATATIKDDNILVVDQYGRTMKLDSTWFGNYKLVFTTSAVAKVSLPNAAPIANEITADGGSLVMTGVAAGTSTINVSVYDLTAAATVANSAFEFAAQTVAKSAIVEYKVETPEVLYGSVAGYEKAVNVYGLNASGAKVALNPADYVITTNDGEVVYAGGKLDASASTLAVDKEKAVTVLTVISGDQGPVTLANVVTVTTKTPVLTTLEAKTAATAVVKGDNISIPVGDLNPAANLIATINGKDQYGVAIATGITNVLVTNHPSRAGFSVTNNGQAAPTFTGAVAGDTLTVTFITSNGLTKAMNVIVTP